jgi:type IV pilus assembly protein PilV
MRKIMAGEEGFTLTEAMIAIAIIAIGVMGMYTLQISSINSNSRANRITISTDIATDKIEELMALDYVAVVSQTTPISVPTEDDPSGSASTISWNVTNDDPVANTKTIIISVTTGLDTTTIRYIKSDL